MATEVDLIITKYELDKADYEAKIKQLEEKIRALKGQEKEVGKNFAQGTTKAADAVKIFETRLATLQKANTSAFTITQQQRYNAILGTLQSRITSLKKPLDDFGKKSTGVFDHLQNSGQELTKLLIGGLGVGFALESIKSFGEESFKAFEKQQLSLALLRTAVGVNGGLQEDYENLKLQSEDLQKITPFSDETIQAAQKSSLQFGFLSKEVQNLIPIITDFAAATGQDLQSALDGVLRGIEGQARGLKVYGIEVKHTGDRTKDLAQLTDQLTAKFAGQAEIVGKTATGALAILTNQLDDVKEKIGKSLATFIFGEGESSADIVKGEEVALQKIILKINDVNTSQSERIQLIDQLKAKYPGYLKDINADTVSNAELNKALGEVNQSLINKLVLSTKQDEIDRQKEKTNEQRIFQANVERDAIESLIEVSSKTGIATDNSLPLREKILDIIKKTTDAGKEDLLTVTRKDGQIVRLQDELKAVEQLTERVNRENERTLILEKEKQLIEEQLNIAPPKPITTVLKPTVDKTFFDEQLANLKIELANVKLDVFGNEVTPGETKALQDKISQTQEIIDRIEGKNISKTFETTRKSFEDRQKFEQDLFDKQVDLGNKLEIENKKRISESITDEKSKSIAIIEIEKQIKDNDLEIKTNRLIRETEQKDKIAQINLIKNSNISEQEKKIQIASIQQTLLSEKQKLAQLKFIDENFLSERFNNESEFQTKLTQLAIEEVTKQGTQTNDVFKQNLEKRLTLIDELKQSSRELQIAELESQKSQLENGTQTIQTQQKILEIENKLIELKQKFAKEDLQTEINILVETGEIKIDNTPAEFQKKIKEAIKNIEGGDIETANDIIINLVAKADTTEEKEALNQLLVFFNKYKSERLKGQDEISANSIANEAKARAAAQKTLTDIGSFVSQVGSLLNQISDIRIQKLEQEKEVTLKSYDDEIVKINERVDRKEITEAQGRKAEAQTLREKEIKEKELQRKISQEKLKAYKINKIIKAGEVAIQTAVNVVEAYPNPVLIAAAIALGAAEEAIILSQPTPAFKKGVIDFKGKGTETSDDNLVRISKGESVTTAKGTKKYKRVLKDIEQDKFSEKWVTKEHLLEKFKTYEGETLEDISSRRYKTELRIKNDDIVTKYITAKYIAPTLMNIAKESEKERRKDFAKNITETIFVHRASAELKGISKEEIEFAVTKSLDKGIKLTDKTIKNIILELKALHDPRRR